MAENGGGISARFFNFVAQDAHFFTSAFILFTLGVFFGWIGIVIGLLGGFGYDVWHEFWYDPHKENPATRGSDIEDFCFLVSGDLVGVVCWKLAHHLGKIC